MKIFTKTEEETEAAGETLAAEIILKYPGGGAVVALRGGLGAGKTVFTRGFARGMGYSGRVTSPTFAIVNEYLGGVLPVFHFDMYRLSSSDDLFEIGWEDYLDRAGVCVVEWSERVNDALPPDRVFVEIFAADESVREIEISK